MKKLIALAALLACCSWAQAQCGCANPACRCGARSNTIQSNGAGFAQPALRYFEVREVSWPSQQGLRPYVRDYADPIGYDRRGVQLSTPRVQLSVRR